MEAISGPESIQEIATNHNIQVSQWKRQLLEGASELVTRVKKSKVLDAMFQTLQIG
jgi:putative transposase